MIFSIIKVFILSLVEGLTEFVPVSSTGHMILVDQFLKLSDNKVFVDAFKIIIQLGAILSVVVYYWKKIFPFAKGNTKQESMDIIAMWVKIVIAVIPAVILGLKFDDIIEEKFFNSLTVSIMLVFYGILLIWIETRKKKEEKIKSIKEMTIPLALGVGLFQCLAMIPGTSRSAATIIGGVLLGLNRVLATEFSFFLAIPTMLGATLLKIVKIGNVLTMEEWFLIGLGFVLSFIFAYAVIKVFMDYIKKHDFKVFGYYRIILGIIILLLFFTGVIK
ncbi:undecaprenyl-diphosphate phosphatase [Leptotrichia sp. oral taxon 218]|jgi:undecaprenyl-diphosphatase uppP|uniref:undecaprenyl-diphosphate phosphatase n=1 Tax=Leptotrichia sp. oral taxon 218 TaxID=712361 RepID=UPI001B8AF3EA|nr:undecaprenyl-diphosphate phosphatase [Leptotrichia sp. oral taxon 218]QUB95389.1 undecaprenyl-diphosphate phosphatase [Leptotrichia sp. oral taxon 218]